MAYLKTAYKSVVMYMVFTQYSSRYQILSVSGVSQGLKKIIVRYSEEKGFLAHNCYYIILRTPGRVINGMPDPMVTVPRSSNILIKVLFGYIGVLKNV